MACDGTFGGEPGGAESASRPSYRIAGYIDPCESVPSEAQRLCENHVAFSLETRIHKRVACTPGQACLNPQKAGMENLAAQHARWNIILAGELAEFIELVLDFARLRLQHVDTRLRRDSRISLAHVDTGFRDSFRS